MLEPCVSTARTKDTSSHMKKTLRAVGAAGLAAATIVTGLGFGPAAASAVTPSSISAPFQMIWKSGSTYWANVWSTAPTDGSRSDLRSFSSLEDAQAASVHYTYDTDTQQIKVDDKCLRLATLEQDMYLTGCSTENQEKWTFDEDGTLRSAVYGEARAVGRVYATYGVKRASFVTNSSWTTVKSYRGLGADVSDIDLEGGTATLSGVASSDTTDVDISWTTAAGSPRTRNVKVVEGKFSQQLTELAIGTTTVHLKAWDGGDVIAETDVEVKLEVAPVTANAAFTSDVMETVQLSGTAQPNAPIEFRHGENVVGGATADGAGDWSGTINAPNMPGLYNIDVVQKVRGADAGRAALDIDYGPGVSVTSPADDFEIDPEEPELPIRGNAPAGTKVKVYEKGHAAQQLAEPATAGSNGTYRLTTVPLEDREYTLVVEGITKGYNRTRAELTVNPGKSQLTPATVTTKEFTAGTANTFEGTATPDATVEILDADGNDILGRKLTADGQGKWSFTKSFPADATEFSFKVRQTKGADSTTSDLFTVKSDIAGFSPVTMTTKTVIAGLENTFTGTATPGASLRVLNASGSQIVNGTITADSTTGAFTFHRVVSSGASKLDFKIEQTKDGKKLTSPLFSLAADTANAPAPVAVQTKSVEAGVENTFTGTGPAGATYRVLNVSNTQIVPGTFTIGTDGKWTFTRVVSKTASKFDFKLEVTLPSGQTYRTKNFSLQASIFRPVTVDQTSVTPGVSNHFTGTGTPGATYRVLNVSGTQIVPGTLTISDEGKWQFDRVVSSTATNFRFKLEVTKNGQTETSQLFDLPAN